ncbi:MAG: DoxX family membrane protein [Phycisphaeraceae bacterium]|nr:DoxX family membrane protein [Phycisphaeraceae bacterium]
MNRSEPAGVRFAPLLLRLSVGLTFAWSGLALILGHFTPTPREAAVLANLGVAVETAPVPVAPTPEVQTPPVLPPDAAAPGTGPAGPAPAKPAPTPLPPPGQEPMPADRYSGPAPNPDAGRPPQAIEKPAAPPVRAASEFMAPRPVRQVYRIAVAISDAGDPPPGADGSTPTILWPSVLSSGSSARWQAYLAATAAFAGGAMILAGLLTRIWALVLACVMLGTMWLSQLGPAVRTGSGLFSFWPSYDAFDLQAWGPLWLQFALLMSALALMLMGPGVLAMDNALFRRAIAETAPDDNGA